MKASVSTQLLLKMHTVPREHHSSPNNQKKSDSLQNQNFSRGHQGAEVTRHQAKYKWYQAPERRKEHMTVTFGKAWEEKQVMGWAGGPAKILMTSQRPNVVYQKPA